MSHVRRPSWDKYNAAAAYRVFGDFVSPSNLCKWNSFGNLETRSSGVKRGVQIAGRQHLRFS